MWAAAPIAGVVLLAAAAVLDPTVRRQLTHGLPSGDSATQVVIEIRKRER
ncbi:hypothetical protein ACQPYK_48555 (plasmid) [Streptosporangium sp. CA-135522]